MNTRLAYPSSMGMETLAMPAERVDPLISIAMSSALAVIVDVDSLCPQFRTLQYADLVRTLEVMAATDAQVVFVSTAAYELAISLRVSVERAWWCHRTTGWDDGGPRVTPGTQASHALVMSQLRSKLPGARVLCISNDPTLGASLDGEDCVMAVGPAHESARADLHLRADELGAALWRVIDLRVHQRRLARAR